MGIIIESCSPCPALVAMASTLSAIATTHWCWGLFWYQRWSFRSLIKARSGVLFLDPRIRYGATGRNGQVALDLERRHERTRFGSEHSLFADAVGTPWGAGLRRDAPRTRSLSGSGA